MKKGVAMRGSIGNLWLMLATCVVAALFSTCGKKVETDLKPDDILGLKARYDAATINYFYETVFHEDFENTNLDNLRKWNSDPEIVLAGNPSAADSVYVSNVIIRINNLKLPFKCRLKSKSDTNSIELFFGNVKEVGAYLKADRMIQKDVDTTSHFGLAKSESYDGIIRKAYIGICFNENDTTRSIRENIILEEIIQSLGITGDSYTYPGSLFFQNHNPAKSFTGLDHAVLSLLYDPVIPANYPRKSFEKDFADLLYHVNADKKIKELLKKFPQELLSGGDLEACFTAGELLKHPKAIEIHLSGVLQNEDSAFVKQAIISLNKISPNLNLSLAKPGTPEPDHGIVLNFKQANDQKEAIQRTIETLKGRNCMFPKLIKSKAILSLNGSEKSKKFRQQSIIDALYFSLVQLPQNRLGPNKLFEIRNGTVDFNKHYADLLRIIYSDELVDGLKMSELTN